MAMKPKGAPKKAMPPYKKSPPKKAGSKFPPPNKANKAK